MVDKLREPSSTHTDKTYRSYQFILAAVLILAVIFVGCDSFLGHVDGEVAENNAPTVEFSNVPAYGDTFAYAPVIYWKGSDPDGFVEYYEYADIIDSNALRDPVDYMRLIDPEDWVRTEQTADTVYLLTESGQITEHVFYLRCVDDQGEASQTIYRSFYRSNQPPFVPEIKWFTAPDDDYATDVVLEDTLYVLDNITDVWPGLGFTWKSSDPDDKDLYKIPLEFRYYLETVPNDTIYQWVSQGWSNSQELQIFGLETGHYKLTVWARDDGFEMSSRPASITFDVYKPTFEKPILLLNLTRETGNLRDGMGDVVPGTLVGDWYRNLMDHSAAEMAVNYPGWADYEYRHFPNGDTTLYKSFLGQFSLVIYFSENISVPSRNPENVLNDYVRVGGRLWAAGAFVARNLLSRATMGLTGSDLASSVSVPGNEAEFVQATSGVSDLPDLGIDTTKTTYVYRVFFDADSPYKVRPLLPGVDIITAGGGAETAYYFKSYTDTASGDIWNDTARVASRVDTIYYPPTPLDCLVKLSQKRVSNVTRIYNETRDEYGEVVSVTNNVGTLGETVVRVSYSSGRPWSPEDLILVDYSFLPYSDFHFKPCAIRYELLSNISGGGFEVRYRVAVFTFPLYYLDNSNGAVNDMFTNMLLWFFTPYAH